MSKVRALCWFAPVMLLLVLIPGRRADAAVTSYDLSPGDSSAAQVNRLADAFMQLWVEVNPELGTAYALPGARHDLLEDLSPAAIRKSESQFDKIYEALQHVDAAQLDGRPEWVTYGFLKERLESDRQARVCRDELWGVDQLGGWQVNYPILVRFQPVGTPSARAAALARFGSLPAYVDTQIANLREGIRLGYTAPRISVERVIQELDGLLAGPPTESPFFDPARRDSTPTFRAEWTTLISDEINPAIKHYRDFLQDEYLPAARTAPAVAANPDGAVCYQAKVRARTSLNLTPQEIHDLGLRTMAQIEAEMRVIAERSFGTSDVPVLLQQLKGQKEYLFNSRQEILDDSRAALQRAKDDMGNWFGTLPKADVVLDPVPAYEEASAPAGQYIPPPDDGSRPGMYRINLHEPENQPRAPLESIAFHEMIPGHHLQIAIAQERTAAHPITRFLRVTAFTEGWGLYSERLADEMGLYSSDLERLGMLSSQAFRAARLVVDSGIHALGWTREQAIDYMDQHTLESRDAMTIEVDRYIIWPGQATAYMIGELEIQKLRKQAEQALGPKFDIRAFHDEVLKDGAVTLPMLDEKIERWIKAQQ